MAVKVMTPAKGELNKITPVAFETAEDTANGFQFALPRASDEFVVVLVHNTGSSAYNFTVKKPTKGSYFASASDEVYEVKGDELAVFRFESAKWANNDGTITCIPGNVAVKAAVLY